MIWLGPNNKPTFFFKGLSNLLLSCLYLTANKSKTRPVLIGTVFNLATLTKSKKKQKWQRSGPKKNSPSSIFNRTWSCRRLSRLDRWFGVGFVDLWWKGTKRMASSPLSCSSTSKVDLLRGGGVGDPPQAPRCSGSMVGAVGRMWHSGEALDGDGSVAMSAMTGLVAGGLVFLVWPSVAVLCSVAMIVVRPKFRSSVAAELSGACGEEVRDETS